ncbi:DUF6475 domain-containing protein [Pseudomonas anguilliseptica]|uniref:DUF6475 domain-containing protein n=1 Tax=Pseudomonas anguilliseptica TaxID=53406 RepID=UPI0022AFC418|nr:DUF6475 domain-containing protein [Pseudomonas anguilliseptica]MCZ4321429.1 DUF6475 domain-containing protein [Pseudomonas anguilliseptica]
MRAEDKKDLAAMLAKVMSVYGKQITSGFVDVFFDSLAAYDLESVRRGLNAHVQNPDSGQFPPKPADVVRLIDGTSQDQGMHAWSRVDKAVRRVGPYQSVVFDDPIVHRVLDDMGGWVKLCNTSSEEDYKFQGLEFARRYRACVIAGGVGDNYPHYLIGMTEAENSNAGFKVPEPLLIGDRAACLGVLRNGAGGRLSITRAGKSVGQLIAESKRLGPLKQGETNES